MPSNAPLDAGSMTCLAACPPPGGRACCGTPQLLVSDAGARPTVQLPLDSYSIQCTAAEWQAVPAAWVLMLTARPGRRSPFQMHGAGTPAWDRWVDGYIAGLS